MTTFILTINKTQSKISLKIAIAIVIKSKKNLLSECILIWNLFLALPKNCTIVLVDIIDNL